jgi:hypothetical protein
MYTGMLVKAVVRANEVPANQGILCSSQRWMAFPSFEATDVDVVR